MRIDTIDHCVGKIYNSQLCDIRYRHSCFIFLRFWRWHGSCLGKTMHLGGAQLMSSVGDRSSCSALALAPVAIAAFGYGISLLPHDLLVRAATVLGAWLMLSFPIGLLVGHCVPAEDRA